MPNIYKCNYCKEQTNQRSEIALDGIKDIYHIEVCDKCYEKLSDYFPPEDIDKMFS